MHPDRREAGSTRRPPVVRLTTWLESPPSRPEATPAEPRAIIRRDAKQTRDEPSSRGHRRSMHIRRRRTQQPGVVPQRVRRPRSSCFCLAVFAGGGAGHPHLLHRPHAVASGRGPKELVAHLHIMALLVFAIAIVAAGGA